MVCYVLGTQEQQDTNRYPYVLYHWTGMTDTVSCFIDLEEANNWIYDVNSFCNVVAVANQYADTPRHCVEFIERIIPKINAFLNRWGLARVPQDIRSSVSDGYSYFGLGEPPIFPSDIIWNG